MNIPIRSWRGKGPCPGRINSCPWRVRWAVRFWEGSCLEPKGKKLMAKIVVVGGGYAGVSAATALAERGFSVDLLETRSSLGGRVYSIPPGEPFPASCDNGPHLFLGCYRDTWTLFKRLEAENAFHWIHPLEITWVAPGG